jgi:hypothetical protein
MSNLFEIKIEKLPELRQSFKRFPTVAAPILSRTINMALALLGGEALQEVPVKTTNLRKSFKTMLASPTSLVGAFWPTAKYAPYVEYGTRPHIIRPKNARVLAWESGFRGMTTSKGGKRYYANKTSANFAAYVNHPGTKPNPFMERIIARTEGKINDLFSRALEQILAST